MLTALPDYDDHEMVLFCRDADAGLTAIIAVHSTLAGPACGGTRMWTYADDEAAVTDVLRLSRGMTFKTIMAGLPLGGGKSVILGDPRQDKSDALFRAFGRKLEALGGRYIAAEDVGISVDDIALIHQETEHVAGRRDVSGDPSPVTAHGVFQGLKAALREAFGSDDPTGRIVAVQGLGHVGWSLAEQLSRAGARLIVADVDDARVQRAVHDLGATPERPDAIHAADCDVYAPCALGGAISETTLPDLRCRVVAGAANNQLATPAMGRALDRRGILYAPDYVINAGGIINVAAEVAGDYDRAAALAKADRLGETLTEIFTRARQTHQPPSDVADAIALERLAALRAERRAAAE